MKNECCGFRKYRSLLSVFLLVVLALSGCTNAEKAKTEHVRRGDAYLKDQKYNEASLEYRGALQIDGNMAAAHWGLAQAFEGLQRFPEMVDELRRTIDLDKNNLDARIKLGNNYLAFSKGQAQHIDEAERLAKDIIERKPNNTADHILLDSIS